MWLFVALILVNGYTANLAASMTVTQINSQITSVEQLRGRAVQTNDVYLARLRANYGILASPAYSDETFVQRAAADIVSGALTALISDAPLISSALQEMPGCQVRMLDQVVEPFSYGWAFSSASSDADVEAFSEQVLELQESGALTRLADIFLARSHLNSCGNDVNEASSSFSFQSVYGLWIILAAALGVAFLIMGAARVRMRRKRKGPEEGPKRDPGALGRAWLTLTRRGGTTSGDQPMPPRGRELVHLGSLMEEGGGEARARPEPAAPAAAQAVPLETASSWPELTKLSMLQRGQSLFGEETVWKARADNNGTAERSTKPNGGMESWNPGL